MLSDMITHGFNMIPHGSDIIKTVNILYGGCPPLLGCFPILLEGVPHALGKFPLLLK